MKTVDASELVPGDVIIVRLGDIVPADIKILFEGEVAPVHANDETPLQVCVQGHLFAWGPEQAVHAWQASRHATPLCTATLSSCRTRTIMHVHLTPC